MDMVRFCVCLFCCSLCVVDICLVIEFIESFFLFLLGFRSSKTLQALA